MLLSLWLSVGLSYRLYEVSVLWGVNKSPGSRACWELGCLSGFSETRSQIVGVRGKCHLKKTEVESVGRGNLPGSCRYASLSYNCKFDKEIPTRYRRPNLWAKKINFS